MVILGILLFRKNKGNIYTKKKVKHTHVFVKWQMLQVSRDYWPDNLKNAMVTCYDITFAVRNHKKIKENVNLKNI